MSTTDIGDVTHIEEAINQIILTRPMERCMEFAFKSDIDFDIFEPNDESTRTLIAYQVKDALSRLEDRIEVLSVTTESEDSSILVQVNYKVLMYDTPYTAQIKVGDPNATSTPRRNRIYE